MNRELRYQEAREATRRAILDAALELFIGAGISQVSMRNIAAKVGYSAGAIYGYFASKDEIVLALAEEGFRRFGDADLARSNTSDPLADLTATAWQCYQFSEHQPEYFALVFLANVPDGGESDRFVTERTGSLSSQVRRCVDGGLFPPSLSASTALRLLWASILGIASMRLSNRLAPGEDAAALARAAINTTIAGLRAGAVTHAPPFEPGAAYPSSLKESYSHASVPTPSPAAFDAGAARHAPHDRLRNGSQP